MEGKHIVIHTKIKEGQLAETLKAIKKGFVITGCKEYQNQRTKEISLTITAILIGGN